MPSEKSARASTRKAERNRPLRTSARTLVARAYRLIAEGSPEAAVAVRQAVAALDSAAQKGALHANNAARRKGRLLARLAKASKATQESKTS